MALQKFKSRFIYTSICLIWIGASFSVSKKIEYKVRAKELVNYLNRERRTGQGGYTELDEKGNISYKSNPHMHLFESAIAWMQVDSDQEWKVLGQELVNLALTKFIEPTTHMLGEYFDSNWNHFLENGSFVYEPGHQFEWAWLMSLYQELTGQDLMAVRHQLFRLANEHGTSSIRKIAFDEMWSNHTPKLESSRFWPQCERIKAAVRLGTEVDTSLQSIYSKAADDAMETLFKFFGTPLNGLWYDQLSASDTFAGIQQSKFSVSHSQRNGRIYKPKRKTN